MQTVLLTIWPFLNLLLFIGGWGSLIRYVSHFSKNKLYVVSALFILAGVATLTGRSAIMAHGGEYTFVFQQPQLMVPLTNQAYHDGVLLNSPTFSIKSHVAVWPIRLPNASQPTEPGSGLSPDAIQTTLLIKATDIMPGLQWIPQNTSVRVLVDQQLVYRVSGYIRWRLLGLPVYNQEKSYKGVVKI
ncbi:hypothetical protein [Fibrella arboris]|uniref:hypothetical protein n=1 Tax=Fibrella arboris TaxID=3242486 RepID=UPI003520826B